MVEKRFPDEAYPLVVAHRGASATHPENTLPAFQAAVEAGAQAVELDVRLTSDGVLVVLHDQDVSRTTDGTGFVHDLSLAEIKRLDASGGEGPVVKVPTLREVLELVSGRAGVNLEIKNIPGEASFDSPREAVVEGALEELEATSFSGPVLISSFNWLSIERARQLAPDVSTGFLSVDAIEPLASLVYARGAGHDFVLPSVNALVSAGEGFVAQVHGASLRAGTWTADDPDLMRTLFSWGVDAVATNTPETAVAVREEFLRDGMSPVPPERR
jgi:glycerophosphoryl diester phosphodiesterase